MEGKITRVVNERAFFFIDNDYWCHFNGYKETPVEGDIVEYEREIRNDKKNAKNVRFLRRPNGPLEDYLTELKKGYFRDNHLREEFIIDFPQKLAALFGKDDRMNKPSQIRKYFEQCKTKVEGRFRMTKDFNYVKKELLILVPVMNNAKQKGYISSEFFTFFESNVNMAVQNERNFIEGFMPHFQSIIGYYKS